MQKQKLNIGCRSSSAADRSRSEADRRRSRSIAHLTIAVSVRRQTLEEERRFNAALNVVLTEVVRQQLDRQATS